MFGTRPSNAAPANTVTKSGLSLIAKTSDQLRRAAVVGSLRLGIREVYGELASLHLVGDAPVLVIANHVCAWDAEVAMLVTQELGRQFSLAAAPSVLERWPILRRVGFFPIERGANLKTAQILRAIGKDLDHNNRKGIWIFPHGCHVRTGVLVEPERGALAVARAAPRAKLVPVALHYELFEGRRPTAWVKALPAVEGDASRLALGELIARASSALAADLRNGADGYRPLLNPGRRTVLLENVPCDVRRIDAALDRADLPLTFESALSLNATELEQLQPPLLAAVGNYAGPLYRDLFKKTLDEAKGGTNP
ncbi:MAG: uncharacterized protein JWO14_3028 [Solirubrobacterales bacterium]|nr:uncharacterized protein [Solirubrobacterales bacterium]